MIAPFCTHIHMTVVTDCYPAKYSRYTLNEILQNLARISTVPSHSNMEQPPWMGYRKHCDSKYNLEKNCNCNNVSQIEAGLHNVWQNKLMKNWATTMLDAAKKLTCVASTSMQTTILIWHSKSRCASTCIHAATYIVRIWYYNISSIHISLGTYYIWSLLHLFQTLAFSYSLKLTISIWTPTTRVSMRKIEEEDSWGVRTD